MPVCRAVGTRLFNRAIRLNIASMARLLGDRKESSRRLLDLGCWDGATLGLYAPDGSEIFGLERDHAASVAAAGRGIHVVEADLDERLPFGDEEFDVVTSHQVIEHVRDTDNFVSETSRVLRPRGFAVVSTENLASWHNTLALLFGWQPFSLTNVTSRRSGLGNPWANLRSEDSQLEYWHHVRVFSYRGLRELFEAHGFSSVKVSGAGYYPLPATLGKWDPRHAAFITVTALRR